MILSSDTYVKTNLAVLGLIPMQTLTSKSGVEKPATLETGVGESRQRFPEYVACIASYKQDSASK
jgi:hypothetical protein